MPGHFVWTMKTLQACILCAKCPLWSYPITYYYNVNNYVLAVPTPPIISASVLSATSATISWILQQFSLPLAAQGPYTYTLSRRPGPASCDNDQSSRPPVATSNAVVTFTDLQEFSNYRIMVTATFNAFGTAVDAEVAMADFATPSAGGYV
jgi:hypothetical protein